MNCKAFDCVPHKRLLLKIEKLGITGNVLKWIKSFLSNRLHRVVIMVIHLNGQKYLVEYLRVLSSVPYYLFCMCMTSLHKLIPSVSCL